VKKSTKQRKQAASSIPEAMGQDEFLDKVFQVVAEGKIAFDALSMDLGRMLAEAIMHMDREQEAGPDYHPKDSAVKKWASQAGSIFVGREKMAVERPRLRGPEGEIALQSYEKLKQRGQFSEEILAEVLRGMSGRQYEDTVTNAASAFGVSKSSVSRHVVEATSKQLKAFYERDLSAFSPFSVFLDTIHRGGHAFIVALGINVKGEKKPLGFWEGATENKEICTELFADLERRGLELSKRVIFVTDGGKGMIKALKDKFGKKLIHQRCTIHKDGNLQKHLPKKYRQSAQKRFRNALALTSYHEAKKALKGLEKWLRSINESAANSLNEALEEVLTLHRLKVPAILRKSLHSTNPIESMFASVRQCEHNVKRYKTSKMAQRWLGSVLLHCEKKFRRVKGFREIEQVIAEIEKRQQGVDSMKQAA